MYLRLIFIVVPAVLIVGCGGYFSPAHRSDVNDNLGAAFNDRGLASLIENSVGCDLNDLLLPGSDDFASIPQDPKNPITADKVALGRMLFHETALATNPNNFNNNGNYSCASCHHVAAGFKAGAPQGIGEGGQGFGQAGEGRVLEAGFSPEADDETLLPDIQTIASPAILNLAYQEVMLWNGQFGHMEGGIINNGLPIDVLATLETPKVENLRGLSGIETQAIAGLGVHRLSVTGDSVLQTNETYKGLFDAAYPEGSDDVLADAGKAIAAYERTILANQAPFQRWLRGDSQAMTDQEKRGAILFFGQAGCAACHRGPALSSPQGAPENEVFFALGFADLDPNDPRVHGVVDEKTALGRGGFTGQSEDNYKFKVPQLYNLADSTFYGHGASFSSIRDVVVYKNTAVPQKHLPEGVLDPRFVPLGLSADEIDDITAFLTAALRDPNLSRYVPGTVPSGNCFPNNDSISRLDMGC
jgi:cytochrome c peroxidase